MRFQFLIGLPILACFMASLCPAQELNCITYKLLSGAVDPELNLLMVASQKAVESKRAFGVEIEFLGDRLKVAEAFQKRYGGTIDRTLIPQRFEKKPTAPLWGEMAESLRLTQARIGTLAIFCISPIQT